MKINYYNAESFVSVPLVDSSHPKYTFIRKDMKEAVREDVETGEKQTVYTYKEARLTKEEYKEYEKEIDVGVVQEMQTDIENLNEDAQGLHDTTDGLMYTIDSILTEVIPSLLGEMEE